MVENKHDAKSNEEQSLKGTFAGVMMLAGFIIVSWLGVFLLFIQRG